MKSVLIELRQWLGVSQRVMASALGIPRSVYSMAELGERSLEPNMIQFLLDLHRHLKQAPVPDEERTVKRKIIGAMLKEETDEWEYRRMALELVRRRQRETQPTSPKRVLQLPLSSTQWNDHRWLMILATLVQKNQMNEAVFSGQFTRLLDVEIREAVQRAVVTLLQQKLAETGPV